MQQFIASAHTFVGRRKHNEDAYLLDPKEGVFAVADGMGGYAGGEVASRLAVESLAEFFQHVAEDAEATWPCGLDPRLTLAENRVDAAIRLANRRICAAREGSLREMGSTIALVALQPGAAIVAHLGDSRVYRLRDGKLEQLTCDHSLYEQLRAGGVAVPPLAEFAYTNVITRALGPQPEERPELQRVDVRAGDRLLLCTDGLTGALDAETIAALLGGGPVEVVCERLVHEAFLAGSRDNITAIVIAVLQ
ncbi:MAG TPA: protein phosphatase 2C domain-containing protein [Nannocystis sp.]